MKKLFLFACVMLGWMSCSQQTEEAKIQFMPFQETEKSGWGLIGTDGQVLVSDDYKQMPTVAMHNRFFAKNKNGKWELYGVENYQRQIGNDEYTQAGAFVDVVAPVVEAGKSISFIDINGDVKFNLDVVNGKEVSTCTNFSNGVAVFRAGKYCGAINTNGDVIVDPRYIEILPANEGKMLALDKKYEKNLQEGDIDNINYTVISTTGEVLGDISTRRFKIASRSFVSGALVVTDESGNGTARTGLIDVNGNWIVKASDKIKTIKAIQNNTFIYGDGDAYGVMDFEGKIVIRPRYANLIYANQSGLLFAKDDKENAEYKLMDLQEKQVGKEEYSNVLPFIDGNAIVQESADNWILINEQGEDQKLKQDIYSISASAFGDQILVSEHVDYESVVNALKLTKDGFLDMTLNMDAEHIANTISSIALAGELGGEAVKANPAGFVNTNTAEGYFIANGIRISLSSTFDENMAASAEAFKPITPNQIGLQIPAVGMLRGKSGVMAKDIISRVQAFGQIVKANQNAAIVKVGEAAYFVANSGTGVYVVYGLLDVNQIDISQYESIVDKEAAPVKRYEVEVVFDNIERNIDDVYEIGGAFEHTAAATGEGIDELLDAYEKYVASFAATAKKMAGGNDMAAIAEMATMQKDLIDLSERAEKAKGDFTADQLKRYTDITARMAQALAEAQKQ